MRPFYSKCANLDCENATSISSCGSSLVVSNIFMEVINKDAKICNGITIGDTIGIIIGSIIILHIVLGLAVLIYQCCIKKSL